MSEKDYSPLPALCARALKDKLVDKRKIAVVEIERMIKDFVVLKNDTLIQKLIDLIGKEFIETSNPNAKRGGLMAIATISIALGSENKSYTKSIILPIIGCFSDYDPSIRYAACESMYNVIKTLRNECLEYFPIIFDHLIRLVSDPDLSVRNAAETLDKILKDIVAENGSLDLDAFMNIVRERIYSKDQLTKAFIITWISLLDAIPDLDLLPFLPLLLDGLFLMLKDSSSEIRKTCETILSEFHRKIKKNSTNVQMGNLINILIIHSQAKEENLQLTSLFWIKEFIEISNVEMLPHISGMLSAVLPCLAYKTDVGKDIRENAVAVNEKLMNLVIENVKDSDTGQRKESIDLNSIVNTLLSNLSHHSFKTKLAVLNWIEQLLNKVPTKMIVFEKQIFPILLKKLSDSSGDFVLKNLEILSKIIKKDTEGNDFFGQFIRHLLELFRSDNNLLESRGPFFIRVLCNFLDTKKIFVTLSESIEHDSELKFARKVVETLFEVFLSVPELHTYRMDLRSQETKECQVLFRTFFRCWSHSCVATIGLCLLTRNYSLTYSIVRYITATEISVEFLIEIDKLIQLIETPAFVCLRMDLLDTSCNKELLKSLYGLLMILPQSETFYLLKNRLECVPHCCAENINSKKSSSNKNSEIVDKSELELLELLQKVQEMHMREAKPVFRDFYFGNNKNDKDEPDS